MCGGQAGNKRCISFSDSIKVCGTYQLVLHLIDSIMSHKLPVSNEICARIRPF